MFIIGNIKSLLVTLAAIAVSAAVLAGPAGAYQCKAYPTQASATYKARAVAQAKARANWQAQVKGSMGLSWSLWSIAQAKSISCNRQSDRWICLASARPCNYVVP
jgi:hypothetical protein